VHFRVMLNLFQHLPFHQRALASGRVDAETSSA
jgi:hypothetical protein